MKIKIVTIKILVFVVLAYILVFNIGGLLEINMIHKEYMACLYDFDYKSSIQHTQLWCITNIFLANLTALLFVIYQTKRSRVRTVCLYLSVVFLLVLNSKTIVDICNMIDITGEWRVVNLIIIIIAAILLGTISVKDNEYNKEGNLFNWISWIGVIFAFILSVISIYIFV